MNDMCIITIIIFIMCDLFYMWWLERQSWQNLPVLNDLVTSLAHISIRMWEHMCAVAHIYICMHLCIFEHVYASVYIRKRAHWHITAYMYLASAIQHIRQDQHTHTRVLTHTHARTHTYYRPTTLHTQANARIHTHHLTLWIVRFQIFSGQRAQEQEEHTAFQRQRSPY